jgi:HEAT repeat protein
MRVQTTLLTLLAFGGAAVAQNAPAPIKVAAERAPNSDEDLALAALEGLMHQPSERALPLIKRVLTGSRSVLVKQRALFVLSQIDSPEAAQLLSDMARSADPALRNEAIRSIGIGGNAKMLDELLPLYNGGGSDVKEAVLQAWLIANRKEAIYQVALNAKSEDEVAKAVRLLGAMGAKEELRKLGDRPNATSGLVEAYAIAGDLASLRKIVDGNGNRDLRIDAIRKIGIVETDAAKAALQEIYTRSTDADIREAALQGMLIADDDKGVLSLYRAAKSSDEKRALMRTLATMDGEAALQAIDAALEEKK